MAHLAVNAIIGNIDTKLIEIKEMKKLFCLMTMLCAGMTYASGFELVTAERVVPIVVTAGEPEYVRLAAEDLASDVQKITGKKPVLIMDGKTPQGGCVVIGTVSNPNAVEIFKEMQVPDVSSLQGKWESHSVAAVEGNRLAISGSDAHGTMFGVYDFIERYLHVDPMWFWSGREPKKCAELKWQAVSLVSGPPTFKFRGWFINDEDLLTFWLPDGGTRTLPYKFYANLIHPDAIRPVAEALVRSRHNLVIPASFIDILNPAEELLVQECSRRGLYLSMHHQEPLGVSAWVYFNYWQARGRDLKYSYVSNQKEIQEVWRAYAKKWAEYPHVIWQLGLRGKGDRPMWEADESTPQSDADRGKIISDAMAEQVKILDKFWPKDLPRYMSTTLWAEGAILNQKGLLTIPENTIIVFADNSPGWKWQMDFYETQRNPKNRYGVYYHHALIGSGPHLAQAIPPHKTFALLQEAIQHGSGEYVIFNVSNVREFVLGADATAKMTWRMDEFNAEAWLTDWINERFSAEKIEIANAYKIYFNAYQMHDSQKVPFLLDGQMFSLGGRVLSQITGKIKTGKTGGGSEKENITCGGSTNNKTIVSDAFWASLSDMHPVMGQRESIKRIANQKAGFTLALLHAREAKMKLHKDEATFLDDNLIYPAGIMLRISTWLEQLYIANESLDVGNIQECVKALEFAETAFAQIPDLAEGYCHGKWKNWYRGCQILNISSRLEQTRKTLAAAQALK